MEPSREGGVTIEDRPRLGAFRQVDSVDKDLKQSGRVASGRPVSAGEEPLQTKGAIPPLKLLGNIFASSHIPRSLKPHSTQKPSSTPPTAAKSVHRTPRSAKLLEAGENSPPQALRLQQVQCSKEIAEAFHTGKSGAGKQASQTPQPEVARPKAERAVLSARGNEETNRELTAVKPRPQTARENVQSLRIAVPPRDAARLPEAPPLQPVSRGMFSYIGENPLAKPAWGDWQPPLPMRTLRTLAKDGGEIKPFFHEKQSPSPPTVLFNPSSPTSSIGSLDLTHDHSDSCPQHNDSCHRAYDRPHELPNHRRHAENALPPRASHSLEDDQVAQTADHFQAHMSFGSAHPSRVSYIASSSPHRFGRLSSATASEEESTHEFRTGSAGASSDFAHQDELKATPFSLRSNPVIIPASPAQDVTRGGIPLVQSPPNLPRHFVHGTTPCSPNLSRGFMIGQFDGHVPAMSLGTSAPECGPERDGPLATRVSNGATSSPGIPRPGLAQQLHESLNNPNALPGYSVGPVIGEGGFCKVRQRSRIEAKCSDRACTWSNRGRKELFLYSPFSSFDIALMLCLSSRSNVWRSLLESFILRRIKDAVELVSIGAAPAASFRTKVELNMLSL